MYEYPYCGCTSKYRGYDFSLLYFTYWAVMETG